jgi:hypothetical protein
MNPKPEPEFLTREIVDAIHPEQIDTYVGLRLVEPDRLGATCVVFSKESPITVERTLFRGRYF